MEPSESAMVLSNWKKELWEQRRERGWSRGLEERDYWALVNHVLDKITLPACDVVMGCHFSDPETPMCWVAFRRVPGLHIREIVYLYARKSVRQDPALAAGLERQLLFEIEHTDILFAAERRPFNPFLELRR